MVNKKPIKSRTHLTTRNAVIALVSLLTATTYLALTHLSKPTPLGINEVSQSPIVTLSLPSTIPTTTTTDSIAPLTINTGGSKITAVQIELTYDPNSLSNPTLTPGTILPVELVKPKIAGDKIIVTLGVNPDSGGYSGEGVLATLKFRSKNGASSSISFTQNTLVAAIGSSGNALKASTGGTTQIPTTPPANTASPTPFITPLKATPSPTPKSTKVKPKNNSPAIEHRVFNESGNFAYSDSPLPTIEPSPDSEIIAQTSKPSLFERLKNILKSIFTPSKYTK